MTGENRVSIPTLFLFGLPLLGGLAAGCAPYGNEPFRTGGIEDCTMADCGTHAVIEHHDDFDLAYVEFTERGNVFDRKKMREVLDYLSRQAAHDSNHPEKGVTAVVFTHGWKHNARSEDTNVESFRDLLSQASKLPRGPRRLVGIYIGWRGLSVDFPGVRELSYWDRKSVAQQVGKGGVTELLLRLENIVVDDAHPNRNVFLVTGHSFGGAIVLSALNEILLERVVDARKVDAPSQTCISTRPFGHGVVLLNPAIEANEALQLKERVAEISAETPFCPSQDRLMHVISSFADQATGWPFRWGQRLGVNLTWKQAGLERSLGGRELRLEESNLDTTTAGNYAPFMTGSLTRSPDNNWVYRSCIEDEAACLGETNAQEHIRVLHNEPLAFIRTDENFIADHNDVFNDFVAAYLATIVEEARHKRSLERGSPITAETPDECRGDGTDFPFQTCFAHYQENFERVVP